MLWGSLCYMKSQHVTQQCQVGVPDSGDNQCELQIWLQIIPVLSLGVFPDEFQEIMGQTIISVFIFKVISLNISTTCKETY
jgi:hypothetical protein